MRARKALTKKKPTSKQIASQIAALEHIKPKVLMRSAFGDNHHDAIDAQIEVLKTNLSERGIDDRSAYEDEDGYGEDGRWKTNVRDSAQSAREWLDGKYEGDNLIDEWKDLVR